MQDNSCFIAGQNSGTSSSLAKLSKEVPAESNNKASPPRYETTATTPPPSHATGTSQKGKDGAGVLDIVVMDGILCAACRSPRALCRGLWQVLPGRDSSHPRCSGPPRDPGAPAGHCRLAFVGRSPGLVAEV